MIFRLCSLICHSFIGHVNIVSHLTGNGGKIRVKKKIHKKKLINHFHLHIDWMFVSQMSHSLIATLKVRMFLFIAVVLLKDQANGVLRLV